MYNCFNIQKRKRVRKLKAVKPKNAVFIVKNREAIQLLADFTRAEIIRLLSRHFMTEKQLSDELGITKAAVGYHLHLLLKAGLIEITKLEAEEHGILQKYYAPVAAMFIIDTDNIPKDVKRFFIQTQIEHLRGMFIVFRLCKHISEVSSEKLEELASALLKQLKQVAQKHLKDAYPKDPESFTVRIYSEAVAKLTEQKEWRNLFRSRAFSS
jgi:predicted transcriptional regulator